MYYFEPIHFLIVAVLIPFIGLQNLVHHSHYPFELCGLRKFVNFDAQDKIEDDEGEEAGRADIRARCDHLHNSGCQTYYSDHNAHPAQHLTKIR